jgi:hypothetical protein
VDFMGYDMYVVKPHGDTRTKINQLKDARQELAAIFAQNHPIKPLIEQQYQELQKLVQERDQLAKNGGQKSNVPLDKQIDQVRKSYQDNSRIFWQQEAKALKDIDDELQVLENKTYFRLNIWGMSHYCAVMDQLAMLAIAPEYQTSGFSSTPQGFPGWPENATFEMTDQELDDFDNEYYDNPSACPDERYRNYKKAGDEARAWSFSTAGINEHKFSSNDGWIVTPKEIESALDTYQIRLKTDSQCVFKAFATIAKKQSGTAPSKPELKEQMTYWNAWIEFLQNAKDGEGFSVY